MSGGGVASLIVRFYISTNTIDNSFIPLSPVNAEIVLSSSIGNGGGGTFFATTGPIAIPVLSDFRLMAVAFLTNDTSNPASMSLTFSGGITYL